MFFSLCGSKDHFPGEDCMFLLVAMKLSCLFLHNFYVVRLMVARDDFIHFDVE